MRGQRALWRVVGMAAGVAGFLQGSALATGPEATRPATIIGMYVHQHWSYNHPYAARTWTLDDWRGYADGLRQIGYNTILVWPVLETMPDPLTPSDRASLAKIAAVIDMLHNEMGMRVYLALCPNVGADNAEAAKATFEKRRFFHCDTRINPGDPAAMRAMIAWREKLLRPLAAADGVAIIDSDPGGYPGSTNAEFVNLLGEHRKMLDRLRPGIELYYWMHVGWEGYCRFYKTARFSWGTAEEQVDVLRRLKDLNPEPWGLANGLPHAEKLGLADRVISFNYGRIEGEPSFPMTNFGGTSAYEGGRGATARGVMGNAQTHCVQLPNTFAFVRGATGRPLDDADYVRFADDLIPGQGETVVSAWKALAGNDPAAMSRLADRLERLPDTDLRPGRLKGLLFGSPRRFVNDLVMQLRLRAAFVALLAAAEERDKGEKEQTTEKGAGLKTAFARFVDAAEIWQRQHGYENAWSWPGLQETLKKLNLPAINAVVDTQFSIEADPDSKARKTPLEQIQDSLRRTESYTPRLLEAMKKALQEM